MSSQLALIFRFGLRWRPPLGQLQFQLQFIVNLLQRVYFRLKGFDPLVSFCLVFWLEGAYLLMFLLQLLLFQSDFIPQVVVFHFKLRYFIVGSVQISHNPLVFYRQLLNIDSLPAGLTILLPQFMHLLWFLLNTLKVFDPLFLELQFEMIQLFLMLQFLIKKLCSHVRNFLLISKSLLLKQFFLPLYLLWNILEILIVLLKIILLAFQPPVL